jgi:excisionase family DNA binding protein
MLESPDTSLATKSPDARLFAAQLVEALTSREQPRSEGIRVSEKILLNLNDCRLLTGLSDANLRDAIHKGRLKAKIIGRGWKVKKQDLNEYVDGL